MGSKGFAVTMALGVAAGAVGILMLSRTNPARKLASQAADKVEDVAWMVSDKLTRKYDM
ncbi:MAG: hypothetical protein IJF27_06620 [Oscillospiraceae bacterium]|nr:hypothetical protein [Oscillospiraceae bacterium]